MKKLEKETRYSDIVLVFETYLNKMNISNGYAILNDHIDLYSKALYFMVNIIFYHTWELIKISKPTKSPF